MEFPTVCGAARRRRQRGLPTLVSMARRTLSSNAQTAAAVRSSPVRGLVVGAGAVLCGVLAARLGYSRFLDAPGSRRAPGRDTSRATVLLDTGGAKAPQPITPSRLGSSQQPQQQRRRALQEVDAEQFATFVAEQRVVLHGAQLRTRAAAAATLHEELQTAVSGPRARVTNFADWYFSYPNTYKLLGVAMSSAAKHAVAFRTVRLGLPFHPLSERICVREQLRSTYLLVSACVRSSRSKR